MRIVRLITAVVLVAGGVSQAYSQSRAELTVFAAADLAFALKEIVPKFEKAYDAKVTLVLGSTGTSPSRWRAGPRRTSCSRRTRVTSPRGWRPRAPRVRDPA